MNVLLYVDECVDINVSTKNPKQKITFLLHFTQSEILDKMAFQSFNDLAKTNKTLKG